MGHRTLLLALVLLLPAAAVAARHSTCRRSARETDRVCLQALNLGELSWRVLRPDGRVACPFAVTRRPPTFSGSQAGDDAGGRTR